MIEVWDTSALIVAARDPARASELADALSEDEVAITEPILIEYLNGARNVEEYDRFDARLRAARVMETNAVDWTRALEVHRQLAATGAGHQRSVTLVDLIIAAVAERAGHRIVHVDADYERIAAITGQPNRRLGSSPIEEPRPAPHNRSLAGSLRDKVRRVSGDESWEAISELADSTPDPDRTP